MFQTECIRVLVIPLIIQNQFYTIQNLQRPPISQTSNWSGTFFAFSYSKPALVTATFLDQMRPQTIFVFVNKIIVRNTKLIATFLLDAIM